MSRRNFWLTEPLPGSGPICLLPGISGAMAAGAVLLSPEANGPVPEYAASLTRSPPVPGFRAIASWRRNCNQLQSPVRIAYLLKQCGKEVAESISVMTRMTSRVLDLFGTTGDMRPRTSPTGSLHRRNRGPPERTRRVFKPARTMPARPYQGVWRCRGAPSEHAARLEQNCFQTSGHRWDCGTGRPCPYRRCLLGHPRSSWLASPLPLG